MEQYNLKARQKRFVCLEDELDDLLKHFGLDEKIQELKFLNIWEECVGPTIAKNSKPVEIKRHKLLVSVENAAWRYELSLKKVEIINELNKRMRDLKTGKHIKEITFI